MVLAEHPVGAYHPDFTQTQPIPAITDPVGAPAPESGGGSGKTLIRGGSWNTAAQLAPLIVNLIMTPYVIHGLGRDRFGLFILASSIADFLGTFDGGFYASSQRFFAIYAGTDDRRSTSRLCTSLTAAVICIGAVMVGLLTLTAPLLVELFDIPRSLRGEGQFMLRTLGVVIAFELLRGVFYAILNARQRFGATSLTTVGQYAVYTTGVVLTVSHGWGLRGIALTLLAQTAVSTTIMALAARRFLALSEMRFLPRREIVEFLKYSSRAQVAGLSDLINLQSDSMIIGGFINVGNVTLYSSGRNFAAQMRALPWNAIAPAASMLGQTYGRSGLDAALAQFRQVQRWWVQGCSGWIAVAAGAAFFGVTSWLGPGFRLAGVVAIVLLVGYLFRLWAGMLTVYCQTVGHPELEARYGVVSVLVNLALTLALVVPFGVLGVVGATAAGQLVGSLYLLYIVRRRLSREVPSFLAEVPWLASAVAAALTVGLELLTWQWFARGPLGLLEAGLVAVPGLVAFGLVLLGPAKLGALLSTRLHPLKARIGYGYAPRHGRG